MNEFLENYIPVSAINVNVSESGFYTVTISKVEEGIAVNERHYIAVTCNVENDLNKTILIELYLVEGDNFNRDATLFFDTFGIVRADFDYDTWINKSGVVFIDLFNGNMTPKWIVNNEGFATESENLYEMIAWPPKPPLPVKIIFS